MTSNRDRLFTVADREISTLLRTPQYVLVGAGFVVIVLALAVASGLTGYVPLTVDLLTPVEVLVPLLAVAFGYRALGGGAGGTERPVLRTYPMPRWVYVGGVFVGRAVVTLLLVFLTLFVAGTLVPLLGPEGSSVIATHAGEGSFAAYLRFVVLATVYAGVVLAAVIGVSAVTHTERTSVAGAVGLFVLLTVGIDLGLVGGLATGVVDPGSLRYLQALSPNGAFRGLVLALVVRTVDAAAIPTSAVLAFIVGLTAWLVGSLGLAITVVWPRPGTGGWRHVDELEGTAGENSRAPASDDTERAEYSAE